MEGPILFWGYKKQESNLILSEHDDDDDDDDDDDIRSLYWLFVSLTSFSMKDYLLRVASKWTLELAITK
jgi:hypothetical protein